MAPRLAIQIGERTVVAMTCRQCRRLRPGAEFPRYRRSVKDRIEYQSRRCRRCWWSRMDRSIGKDGIAASDRAGLASTIGTRGPNRETA